MLLKKTEEDADTDNDHSLDDLTLHHMCRSLCLTESMVDVRDALPGFASVWTDFAPIVASCRAGM